MATAAQPSPEFQALLETQISWSAAGDLDIPWRASLGAHSLAVRLNDFPDEALYSLLVDGKVVAEFEDWPALWVKPVS